MLPLIEIHYACEDESLVDFDARVLGQFKGFRDDVTLGVQEVLGVSG